MKGLIIGCFCLFSFCSYGQVNKKLQGNIVIQNDKVLSDTTSAQPKGGYEKLYKYFDKRLKYPPSVKRKGIKGKVYVEFFINKDGTVGEVRTLSQEELQKTYLGYQDGLIFDDNCHSAVRVLVENMPRWKPAMANDKPVKQRVMLPVFFR
ncbi:hypothetical protein GCM10009122_27480 [Fulvivirga kasyanovii]|uniref:TonB C-terminal domain-containing protein n=1 Tax=Fulvivirga kasyanovii TaxID=396812 RepID=A0ABW9RJ18_9BACT|nr:energy transducer TonB [Fulvivirga kasyanovii]MTI23877.1 hypothetical protein [Fulvivirga kasyanovii]